MANVEETDYFRLPGYFQVSAGLGYLGETELFSFRKVTQSLSVKLSNLKTSRMIKAAPKPPFHNY